MKRVHIIYLISLFIIATPFVAVWCWVYCGLDKEPYPASVKDPANVEKVLEIDLPNIANSKSEKDGVGGHTHHITFEQPLSIECIAQLEQLCEESDKWSKKHNDRGSYYSYHYRFSISPEEWEFDTIECYIYSNECFFFYTPDPGRLSVTALTLIAITIAAAIIIIIWTIALYSTAGIIHLIIRKIRQKNNCNTQSN